MSEHEPTDHQTNLAEVRYEELEGKLDEDRKAAEQELLTFQENSKQEILALDKKWQSKHDKAAHQHKFSLEEMQKTHDNFVKLHQDTVAAMEKAHNDLVRQHQHTLEEMQKSCNTLMKNRDAEWSVKYAEMTKQLEGQAEAQEPDKQVHDLDVLVSKKDTYITELGKDRKKLIASHDAQVAHLKEDLSELRKETSNLRARNIELENVDDQQSREVGQLSSALLENKICC
ncbi:hypothetical protein B0J14DRAFT_47565 [Halenospora varia]|nr:hypothetical protein B0J14DRAFT_47565 [Halenospora varia]